MIDEGLGAMASRSSARACGPRALVSLALCAAMLSSACSLVAVRSTPRTARGSERLVCAPRVVPALDLALVAVLGLAGMASVAGSHDDGNGSFGDARRDGMFMGGAALAFLASSVYGFAGVASCHDRKRALELEGDRREAVGAEPSRDEAARERDRVELKAAAWKLTLRAQAAARAGDCSTVQTLDGQVRDLDAAFHAKVFVSDVAIAACLHAELSPTGGTR